MPVLEYPICALLWGALAARAIFLKGSFLLASRLHVHVCGINPLY